MLNISSVTSCSKKATFLALIYVIDFKNVGIESICSWKRRFGRFAIRRVVLLIQGRLPDLGELCKTVLDSDWIFSPSTNLTVASDYVGVYSLGVGAAYRERFHVVLESGYLYLVKTASDRTSNGRPYHGLLPCWMLSMLQGEWQHRTAK